MSIQPAKANKCYDDVRAHSTLHDPFGFKGLGYLPSVENPGRSMR